MGYYWKGIILAAGSGTRLHPITKIISKQLLPVYDKPMVYYPLSVLMSAGIRDILIVTTPMDSSRFQELLSDGSQWGIRISYVVQESSGGLAQAFLIGKEFIGKDNVCLILGDNIFYGAGLDIILKRSLKNIEGATIFGYQVSDASRYGVVEFGLSGDVISIEEKPIRPKSNFAIPGIYFFDNEVINITSTLKPSSRNELEIVDVINMYLYRKQLRVELFGHGFVWFDAGTFESLLGASMFVETIQKRQGFKVACLEEIAYGMGYIRIL